MKIFLLLILIHFVAMSVVKAEGLPSNANANAAGGPEVQNIEPSAQTAKPIDDCTGLLPQVESDSRVLEQKYHSLSIGMGSVQETYLMSFNEMTQTLFQITQAREEEAAKLSQSRDQLRSAMQKFNEQKTNESSAQTQEAYLNLTLQIYNSLTQAQKTLDALKNQLGQVESARSQYSNARQEQEQLDRQKLALEAKLVSLKIKCGPDRRY